MSECEKVFIMVAFAKGWKSREIADTLARPYGSVARQIQRFQLAGQLARRRPRPAPYQRADDRAVLPLVQQTRPVIDALSFLGRPHGSSDQ